MTLHGAYDHQLWLDVGWIGFYLLWGAAALHPSMRQLEQPAARPRARRSRRFRLALLTVRVADRARRSRLVHDLDARRPRPARRHRRVGRALRPRRRCAWPASCASRSARSRASARSAPPAPRSSPPPSRDEIDRAAVDASRARRRRRRRRCCAASRTATCSVVAAADRPAERRPRALVPATPARCSARRDAAGGRRSTRRCAAPACAPTHDARPSSLGLALARRRARPARRRGRARRRQRRSARAARARHPGRARARERGADRGGPPPRAARRASARSSSTRATSSPCSTPTRTIIYQSPSIERVLGYAPEELVGTRFDRLARARRARAACCSCSPTAPLAGERDRRSLECALRHRDGDARQFEILHTNLLDDEHVGGIVLNSRDVSERKAFEEQLAHQAFHDPVTGLANRALFAERVRHAVARSAPRAAAASPSSSSTSTTSRRSTTASATPPATRCCVEVARAPGREHPRQRHRRALRRRRVRRPARGRRAAPGGGRHRRAHPRGARRSRCALGHKELVAARAASASRSSSGESPPTPTS